MNNFIAINQITIKKIFGSNKDALDKMDADSSSNVMHEQLSQIVKASITKITGTAKVDKP